MNLIPACAVLVEGGRTISQGRLPWLRLDIEAREWAGHWVRLVFEASLLDPLTRPVLRIVGSAGHEDVILPAPLFGRGLWIGFLPEDMSELRLSPADWIGPFAFRVVSLTKIGRLRRLTHGVRRHPKATMGAVWAGIQGNRWAEHVRIRRALGATPLAMYAQWRAERLRPFEWDGLDRPSNPATEAVPIHIVLIGDESEQRRHWQDFVVSQPLRNLSLSWAAPDTPLASLLAGLGDDLVTVLRPDDRLADFALAAVAQRSLDEPCPLYYADEEIAGAPLFKPDWSPVLARHAGLAGRAWFARAGWLRQVLPASDPAGRLLAPLPADGLDKAAHIKRVLLSTGAPAGAGPRPGTAAMPPPAPGQPLATIIIPTRNRSDLLSACIRSLLEREAGGGFEAIVIDNGSTEGRTLAFLGDLARDPRFSVMPSPGTFNFAALCNQAARKARGDILVFLNNDTEILSDGWLGLLCGWAGQPDIGAVGAKLLYRDDTLQHGGVVLGMGGRAAHFERSLPRSEAGFFGRLAVPHELSAVTAACMAVSRDKFQKIGGFDERNLPVDLNDIDLCLRLGERGWRTLLEPRAVLHHHESASRGHVAASEVLYRKEIAYFRSRWLHLLRNDPYFHPALSLEWYKPALG